MKNGNGYDENEICLRMATDDTTDTRINALGGLEVHRSGALTDP